MNGHIFIIFCSFVLSVNIVLSLRCTQDACDYVRCQDIAECGPGMMKAPGGHCLCCQLCKKIIGEHEDCRSESLIAGPPSDKVICDKGLICYEGTCQKTSVLGIDDDD